MRNEKKRRRKSGPENEKATAAESYMKMLSGFT